MAEDFCTTNSESLSVKILVVGDHLTGKSTFLESFCNQSDNGSHPLQNYFDYKEFTHGCDVHIKKIKLKVDHPEKACINQSLLSHLQINSKQVNLDATIEFWELSGQTYYRSFLPFYFRNNFFTSFQAVLFMYDMTMVKTFNSFNNWVSYLSDQLGPQSEFQLLTQTKTKIRTLLEKTTEQFSSPVKDENSQALPAQKQNNSKNQKNQNQKQQKKKRRKSKRDNKKDKNLPPSTPLDNISEQLQSRNSITSLKSFSPQAIVSPFPSELTQSQITFQEFKGSFLEAKDSFYEGKSSFSSADFLDLTTKMYNVSLELTQTFEQVSVNQVERNQKRPENLFEVPFLTIGLKTEKLSAQELKQTKDKLYQKMVGVFENSDHVNSLFFSKKQKNYFFLEQFLESVVRKAWGERQVILERCQLKLRLRNVIKWMPWNKNTLQILKILVELKLEEGVSLK